MIIPAEKCKNTFLLQNESNFNVKSFIKVYSLLRRRRGEKLLSKDCLLIRKINWSENLIFKMYGILSITFAQSFFQLLTAASGFLLFSLFITVVIDQRQCSESFCNLCHYYLWMFETIPVLSHQSEAGVSFALGVSRVGIGGKTEDVSWFC